MRRRLAHGDDSDVAQTLGNLARAYKVRGDLASAEPLLCEAYEMEQRLQRQPNRRLYVSMMNYGVLLSAQDRLDDAVPLYREALEMCRQLYPNGHSDMALCLHDLGKMLHEQGEYAEARRYVEEALAMRRKVLGDPHVETAKSLWRLVSILRDADDDAAAAPHAREYVAMIRALHGSDDDEVVDALTQLAYILRDSMNERDALPVFRECLALRRKLHPGDDSRVTEAQLDLAFLLETNPDLGPKPEKPAVRDPAPKSEMDELLALLDFPDPIANPEVEELARAAAETERRLHPEGHRLLSRATHQLARIAAARGANEDAERLWRESLASSNASPQTRGEHLGWAAREFAKYLARSGRFAEAERVLRDAVVALEHGGAPERHAAACKQALVELYDEWEAHDPAAANAARGR